MLPRVLTNSTSLSFLIECLGVYGGNYNRCNPIIYINISCLNFMCGMMSAFEVLYVVFYMDSRSTMSISVWMRDLLESKAIYVEMVFFSEVSFGY